MFEIINVSKNIDKLMFLFFVHSLAGSSSSLKPVQRGNEPQKAQNEIRPVRIDTMLRVLNLGPTLVAIYSKQAYFGCLSNGLVI